MGRGFFDCPLSGHLRVTLLSTFSKGTAMTNMLETNWKLHVESVKWAANSLALWSVSGVGRAGKTGGGRTEESPPPKTRRKWRW